MGPAGDDGAADRQPHPEEGADDRTGSFDPGLETGYLRRAPRDHELSPELGAAPFDPGPGHYDERRAQKAAKRRERQERRRRDAELSAEEARVEAQRFERSHAAQAAAVQPIAQPEPEPAPPLPEPEREPASVTELRPRREPLAERLKRERVEREAAERERRARIETERAERERAEREQRERRRREREERLRRERAALRPARRSTGTRPAQPKPDTSKPDASPTAAARIEPGVKGPVRRRARAAENRGRVAARRRGLGWPTAKAGLAVTLVAALGAALGSLIGLPVPWLEPEGGTASLANSASLFGIDPGTPTGLVRGYVFPLLGPHDFGDKIARFGAPRYGHIHEGQDIFGKTGTPEVAVHDGTVVDRGKNSDPDDGGRGNYVVIYSPPDNHSFVYMHMLKPSPVVLGDQVHSGEVVGQLGCTGSCEGPHLHFEVRVGKASLGADTKPIDPLPFLKQWPQSTPG
jgi:murein DD-endopeptidase MepM/ murein hydrolase activator NlpD